MTDIAVDISHVMRRFGTLTALDGITAQIQAGIITGLVGPDGAGKTTLIRLMTGLMMPDEGTLTVLGIDSQKNPQAIQDIIGYMPQRFGLYEDLSVMENLSLYADLRNLSDDKREKTFDDLLRFTDLKRFTSRLAGRLSGGMKQKLGLACALLTRPKLLLLDEPGVGVDPISRRDLWAMVSDLASDGIGVVWSTAYLDEAEACHHVLALSQGKLIFDGKPQDLTARVKNRVFKIFNIENKRKVLRDMLDRPDVVDGVIQGDALRLVTEQAGNAAKLQKQFGQPLHPAKPRFEDAFIDLLGGVKEGHSVLAENMPMAPPFDKPVIEAKELTKTFGDFVAANHISFSIMRGEIFGLLGPNGAGKSTTFKMLCGLLKPTSGKGSVAGFDLRHDGSKARNRLGYMAQKFSLYGDLTIGQNLDFFAGIYGLPPKKAREKRDEMIKIFDLQNHLSVSTKDLPLGLKQRLALAAAVMHEPQALFLDEPTSGVDPLTRREFWGHINGLVDRGVTVLVTTHFMDEAEYCDRMALIYRGNAIALGTPDELKNSVRSDALPEPTMEDAFIALIERSDNAEER